MKMDVGQVGRIDMRDARSHVDCFVDHLDRTGVDLCPKEKQQARAEEPQIFADIGF